MAVKKHRIFIAINLPEDAKKGLFKYAEKWSELPAKWTSKDNLHITLQFLGNLTDEELGEVCSEVKDVIREHNSFSLRLSQITYGPPKKKSLPAGRQAPRMVWAAGEKSEELSALKEGLENSLLKKISFVPEARTFAPHITLARISAWGWKAIEPEERPEINEAIDYTFTVESIEVMESELKRGGPQYTILESFQLNN